MCNYKSKLTLTNFIHDVRSGQDPWILLFICRDYFVKLDVEFASILIFAYALSPCAEMVVLI